MTTAMVYLAGPITNVPIMEARAWRHNYAVHLLSMLSCTVPVILYDPASAFHVTDVHNEDLTKDLQEINVIAIVKSSVVLIRLIPRVESDGTFAEAVLACRLHKRIIMVCVDTRAAHEFLQDATKEADTDMHPGQTTVVASLHDATPVLIKEIEG